jgi:hypothetical protein
MIVRLLRIGKRFSPATTPWRWRWVYPKKLTLRTTPAYGEFFSRAAVLSRAVNVTPLPDVAEDWHPRSKGANEPT